MWQGDWGRTETLPGNPQSWSWTADVGVCVKIGTWLASPGAPLHPVIWKDAGKPLSCKAETCWSTKIQQLHSLKQKHASTKIQDVHPLKQKHAGTKIQHLHPLKQKHVSTKTQKLASFKTVIHHYYILYIYPTFVPVIFNKILCTKVRWYY